MAEGAPLLREYANKNRIEGSNPSFSAVGTLRSHWAVNVAIHQNRTIRCIEIKPSRSGLLG